MKEKKILRDHFKIIPYSENHLQLLLEKRERSKILLEMFVKDGINPYIYGSVARGDVHNDSDIDIALIQLIAPYQIEMILEKNGFKNCFREIIMATPADTLKLYIYLNELESIIIPLSKLNKKSREFYDYGGKINLDQIKNDVRVPGIDKRLVLIQPISNGHKEYSIIGNENLAAKQLNIGIDLINERKKVLLKREKFGKTGVFLKRSIELRETTELALKKLANKNSIVRKKMLQR
jgi:predicted nucleotidyltransferase